MTDNLFFSMMLLFVLMWCVYGALPPHPPVDLYHLLKFHYAYMAASFDRVPVRNAAQEVTVIPAYSEQFKKTFEDFVDSVRNALIDDLIPLNSNVVKATYHFCQYCDSEDFVIVTYCSRLMQFVEMMNHEAKRSRDQEEEEEHGKKRRRA